MVAFATIYVAIIPASSERRNPMNEGETTDRKELDLTTTAGRVAWLLLHVWADNMRGMAEDLGLNHSAISKIVGGRRGVGGRVLTTIAAHPKINPAWLFTGEGAPLLAARQDPPSGDMTLPVAERPLPGPPEEYPLQLTRSRHPVFSRDHRLSRYWLAVLRGTPIVHAKGEMVAAGDHLLMESDRRLWVDQPQVLYGRLVVVKIGGEDGPDLVLSRAGSRPAGGYLPLDTFGVTKRIVKLSLKAPAQGWSSTSSERQGRVIELENNPDELKAASAADRPTSPSSPVEAPSRPRPPAGAPEYRPSRPSRKKADLIVYLADVVSICVMLIRA